MSKDLIQNHESFGMLQISRVQCGGKQSLFGSSILHSNLIRMSLKEGKMERQFNNNSYYPGKTLFTVDMSEKQFGELITSLNIGSGVPVTIKYKTVGEVVKCDEPPFINIKEVHQQEFKAYTKNIYQNAQNLVREVGELLENKKTLNKQDKQEIIGRLQKISNDIGFNMGFQLDMFTVQMENIVHEAKVEIKEMLQNDLESIKIKQIGDNLLE